jgi:hypothetical protein
MTELFCFDRKPTVPDPSIPRVKQEGTGSAKGQAENARQTRHRQVIGFARLGCPSGASLIALARVTTYLDSTKTVIGAGGGISAQVNFVAALHAQREN